ncbi:putative transcription initiation factor TFIID, 23-30kDa subunit [Lupinus albus]|uniref:Putative transcription initiation factor TFIID, 23-30kDa subunit n=1 Tax=Lupinus albus TaxID=3870 RepID=A0A6A4Q367_LUPAL|nr:putative transcription initiation factor TFIID, 23-30kDa subunit [Lupinus albus]
MKLRIGACEFFGTRLVAVATQKFVAEVAGNALQYVRFTFFIFKLKFYFLFFSVLFTLL